MRSLALALCALLIGLAIPTTASATAQQCMPEAFRQDDLAGTYVSVAHQMRVAVYPCGGVGVMWSNVHGTHEAGYYSVDRLPAGGIIARVSIPDPIVRSLDGRNVIGVKPAEPGWVQVITMGPFGDDLKIYRLKKV